jgi:hypothetical protein
LLKGILEKNDAGCALCPAKLEIPEHILFACPFACCFWHALGAPQAC